MYYADTRAGFARDAFSNTRADLSAQRESSSAGFPAAACLAGCLHAVSSGRQGHRRKRECTLVAAVAEGRWISPGFAECRADLAISVSEREQKEGAPEMGTVVHRRSMQGLTRRHAPANSNHVRGQDKSAGAGRCSDSIETSPPAERKTPATDPSARIERVRCIAYRDSLLHVRGGTVHDVGRQAASTHPEQNASAGHASWRGRADKIAASIRLSTSLATCKSRDGGRHFFFSIFILLGVAAKLARRTRRAGF